MEETLKKKVQRQNVEESQVKMQEAGRIKSRDKAGLWGTLNDIQRYFPHPKSCFPLTDNRNSITIEQQLNRPTLNKQ